MNTIIILLLAAMFIHGAIWGGNLPKPYCTRSCMGKKWKDEFPNINIEEIRTFLLLFVYAFAFKSTEKLKFKPQDKIIDIYNAIYATLPFGVDALELETLAYDIEKKYSINFSQIWNPNVNITLGELFNHVIIAQQDTQAKSSTDEVIR